MVRKKMEGDEEQRRAAAHEARRAGESPSARSGTTGASKQRTHLTGHDTHEERMGTVHRGKQQWPAAGAGEQEVTGRPTQEAGRTFTGRGRPGYGAEHEQVFVALSETQARHDGEAVDLDEIARTAGLPAEETRDLLHDLTQVHRLVTELSGSDRPDMGPRFQVKPRL
ncbi:hypothetical protein H0H10_13075 [Streptomyces sp. TRM S81-3]|uniref:Uncharacterized protein n=1 Tax=Streptomyces griseicoloratus TaxID=2752516 RepID=A0A926L2A2_9ACTN|nr:hypothetical protein [Streptomyces griseicoloratus]MBD0420089.1 hypothetical protein [Streptomyces griseicoloratus]